MKTDTKKHVNIQDKNTQQEYYTLAFFICKKSRFGISVYNIGTGLSLILLETLVIGTCKHPNMSCNVYTKPIVILLAIVLIAVSLVYVFLSRKEKVE